MMDALAVVAMGAFWSSLDEDAFWAADQLQVGLLAPTRLP